MCLKVFLVSVISLCIFEVHPTFKVSSPLEIIDTITSPFRNGLQEYLKCGSITQKFQKLLNTMQLAHAFDYNIKDRIDSTFVCTACKILLDVVIKERHKGLPIDLISSLVIDLCIALNIQTPAVCEGVVRLNINILIYIIDNRPEIKADRICAIVAQTYGCTGNVTDWSINIPSPNSSHVLNKARVYALRPLKILHLTDIHYDRLYLPGSNANCEEPLCCQIDSGKPINYRDVAGFWGDYRDCDIPLNIVVNALDQITHCHPDIDYVYFSGDIISHRVWDTAIQSNTEDICLIHKMILDAFPDIPVFFILGNHEPHPLNVFSPTEIIIDGLSTQWLFDVAADLWSIKLGKEILPTVRRGGFYTVLVKPGFRVVALNSNVAYTFNWWLLYDDKDPYNQLQWLSNVLYEAERNGEFVHIISHLPSTDNSCYRIWSREYRRIINRFSSIIVASFNGHTHYSELILYHSNENPDIPISIAWNGGSLTTFSNNNPNYRIYTIDPDTYKVLDFDEWIFNMTDANLNPEFPPKWYKLYSFKEAYGLDSLEPTYIRNLVKHMQSDRDLALQYFRYRVRESDSSIYKDCNYNCLQDILCGILRSEFADDTQCK